MSAMTASLSKTQGFITYGIWTNLLTGCVLKFQCNGQTQSVRFYTKACSTKRICWQCQHSVSKWKAGGKHLKRNCDHLVLLKHQNNMKTYTDDCMCEGLFAQTTCSHKQKHTCFTIFPTLSVINTFIDYKYAHPSLKRDKEEVGEGNKSRFTRPVPAPVSNFSLSSLSDALQR